MINRAITFLDMISSSGLEKIDIGRLKKDKGYFEEFYLKLKDNLNHLKSLKDEMEQRGFDSPYFALGVSRYTAPYGRRSYKRGDVEDQRDVARHKMFFRANASFKKGTFERTKSAIASHNIVAGHLEEFVSFNCKCGKITRGKEAIKSIEDNKSFICPRCSSSDVKLEENKQGIFRLELIPYLPFGGESTLEISKFTPTERMAYREIVEVLREKKKGGIKSATISFKVPKKGRWVTKKEQIEVSKTAKLDYEGILREKYGRIAIENIRFHHERSILISGRYNRQALAIAYTKILKEKRKEVLGFLMEKKVDLEKLKEYEELRKELEAEMYGVQYPSYGIDIRVIEERKELTDEFEEELKKIGLMDKKGHLHPELEKAILYRQKARKEVLIKIPKAIFAWDIFRFLLIKPYRERRYASIFPGLQPIPEKKQLESALSILIDKDIISAINTFIDKDVIEVEDACKMIFKKFEIEDVLKDYLKVTSSRAVGGIALYINSNLDLDEVAQIVSVKPKELEEVLKILVRLGREDIIPAEKLENLEEVKGIKISERAKRFLELVRGEEQ